MNIDIRITATAILLGLVLYTVVSAQTDAQKVYYMRGSGFPETLVLKRAFSDQARVCAEPPEGIVACRTVAEFREWVRIRTAP